MKTAFLGIRDGVIVGEGRIDGNLILGLDPDSPGYGLTLPTIDPSDGEPGGPIGTIAVTQNFHMFNGLMKIDIAGPPQPSGPQPFDRIQVGGYASFVNSAANSIRKLQGALLPVHAALVADVIVPFLTYTSRQNNSDFSTFVYPGANWTSGVTEDDPPTPKRYWFKPTQAIPAAQGRIGGNVWLDNGELAGAFEPGTEGGVANVGVRLFDADGNQLADTTTDADGNYEFDGLDAALYRVEFLRPDGMRFAVADATTDDLDSDADPAAGTVSVALFDDDTDGAESVSAGLVADTAPIAADDDFVGHAETSVAGSVLANDSDAEADTLTATLSTGPAHGTLTLNADGSFTYTPDAGFTGADSFTYEADDGYEATDTATATIAVSASPAPAGVSDSYTTAAGPLDVAAAAGVLANDTDQTNGTLAAVLVSGPSHGTLALNADGSFDYVPDETFVGTDSFAYRPTDADGPGEPTTVSIAVTDTPPAVDDVECSGDEDAPVTLDVLSGATDPDAGDTLTVLGASDGIYGTTTVNADGTVTYTPSADWNGTDQFSYVISDAAGRLGYGVATVTVNPVNDNPAPANDSAATNEDAPVTVGVLANDTDVDGDTLGIASVGGASHGTVAISGTHVVYTPNANWNGTDSFTYTASDGHGGTAQATVTVTVNPVNDAPSASNSSVTTPRNTAVDVDLRTFVSDVETPATGFTFAVSSAQHGTVTLLGDGHTARFTPTTNYHGTAAAFDYTATDGGDGASAAITTSARTVSVAVNSPPTASDVSAAIHAGATTTLYPGWSDPDGDTVTITSFTQGAHGGVSLSANGVGLVYNASASPTYTGTDTFTYTIADGYGGTSTGTVTITLTNNPPTANNVTISIHAGGTGTANPVYFDVDGDTVTLTGYTQGAHGSVTTGGPNGTSLVYTASAATYVGSDSFTYTVGDAHGGSATGTVTVNLTNTAPTAQNKSVSLHAGGTATFQPTVADADNDALTITTVTQGSHGSVTIGANGYLTYAASSQTYTGTDTFTYTVSDGHSGTATATVTVTLANAAPTAQNAGATTPRNTPVTVNPTYGDADGDTLTLSASSPGHGTAVVSANGHGFVYTPATGYVGQDSFTYTVSDGHGGTATATIGISVT